MFTNPSGIARALQSFRLDGRAYCYNDFVPKLYNWCLELDFTPGKIMPSRAFCSDESQGVPIILLAKHFGVFPFNHGRVGGIVSVDRHGPHADHGKDLLLLQSSHVGYNPDTGQYGTYRRLHAEDNHFSCSCGKIGHIIESYEAEYRYARENIRLTRHQGKPVVLVDNLLLDNDRTQGLFLNLERLVKHNSQGRFETMGTYSTAYLLPAADALIERLGEHTWPASDSVQIGTLLAPEDFYFKKAFPNREVVQDQLERNLLPPMPWIVSSEQPLLDAARFNTQAEFDRTYRSLVHHPAIHGKNLLFVSGINIDVSSNDPHQFPRTKFVPWAAYLHQADGRSLVLEQDALHATLFRLATDNPSQIDLERATTQIEQSPDPLKL